MTAALARGRTLALAASPYEVTTSAQREESALLARAFAGDALPNKPTTDCQDVPRDRIESLGQDGVFEQFIEIQSRDDSVLKGLIRFLQFFVILVVSPEQEDLIAPNDEVASTAAFPPDRRIKAYAASLAI